VGLSYHKTTFLVLFTASCAQIRRLGDDKREKQLILSAVVPGSGAGRTRRLEIAEM
jgi:hypothetical protein